MLESLGNRLYRFHGKWNPEDVYQAGDDFVWVFGDNMKRMGLGGQACIRHCGHTIGLRTKNSPSTSSVSDFFSDAFMAKNKKVINEDIGKIFSAWKSGKNIVLSANGYGNGLAEMDRRATFSWLYLVHRLAAFERYVLDLPLPRKIGDPNAPGTMDPMRFRGYRIDKGIESDDDYKVVYGGKGLGTLVKVKKDEKVEKAPRYTGRKRKVSDPNQGSMFGEAFESALTGG